MKIVRQKEQKGLVNITLETGRFGRIAAELKAKQKGFSGYTEKPPECAVAVIQVFRHRHHVHNRIRYLILFQHLIYLTG